MVSHSHFIELAIIRKDILKTNIFYMSRQFLKAIILSREYSKHPEWFTKKRGRGLPRRTDKIYLHPMSK